MLYGNVGILLIAVAKLPKKKETPNFFLQNITFVTFFLHIRIIICIFALSYDFVIFLFNNLLNEIVEVGASCADLFCFLQ